MRKLMLLVCLLIISLIPIAAQESEDTTTSWQAVAFSPVSADVVIINENGLDKSFIIDEYYTPILEDWDWSSEATISPDGRFLAFRYNSFVPTAVVDPNPIMIANLDNEMCCIELPLPEGALPGTSIGAFSEDSTQLRIFVQMEAVQNGVTTKNPENFTYDLTTSPPEIIANMEFMPYVEPTEYTRNILGVERVRTGMQTGLPIPTAIRENGMALGAGSGNVVAYYSGDDATPIVVYSREDTAHAQAVWGMNGEAVLVRYDDFPLRPNNATLLFRDGTLLDAEFDVHDIFILHGTPDGWILLLDRFDREAPSRLAHLTVVDGEAQLDILADDLPVDMFLIQKPTLTYEGEAEFTPTGDGDEFVPFAG